MFRQAPADEANISSALGWAVAVATPQHKPTRTEEPARVDADQYRLLTKV
jgi:hypothetical protein